METSNQLDFINKEIIKKLSEDGRLPFSELAKELKISNSLVHQRVKKLQELGIITGYSVDLDTKAMGFENLHRNRYKRSPFCLFYCRRFKENSSRCRMSLGFGKICLVYKNCC